MADNQRIYHNRDQEYSREVVKLKDWEGSDMNKELISRFHNFLFSKGSKDLRVTKLSYQVRKLCDILGKDLDQVTQPDIERLIGFINKEQGHSEDTKADYRRALKQFYHWFKLHDVRLESENKETIRTAQKLYSYVHGKDLKTSCKPKKVDFSNIITEDDIKVIIQSGCRTVKEKAFISVLAETGARASEFLNIRLKDIYIKDNFGLLLVDGKTGERKIPILKSLPYLLQWMEIHPFKENKESYLWIGESMSHRFQPLKHQGGQKLIKNCFARAKLKKKCNYHWFRHSAATLLCPKISQSLLCRFLGWELDSRQVRRYVHLGSEQLETAILAANGFEQQKTKEERPPVCVCGKTNAPGAKYCFVCGKPLDVATAVKDQDAINGQIDARLKLYAEIMADPVKRQQFEDFKKMFVANGAI